LSQPQKLFLSIDIRNFVLSRQILPVNALLPAGCRWTFDFMRSTFSVVCFALTRIEPLPIRLYSLRRVLLYILDLVQDNANRDDRPRDAQQVASQSFREGRDKLISLRFMLGCTLLGNLCASYARRATILPKFKPLVVRKQSSAKDLQRCPPLRHETCLWSSYSFEAESNGPTSQEEPAL
jgi:hypothetical protein